MYIDNVKFAKQENKLDGVINVAELTRMQEIGECSGEVKYSLIGSVDKLNRPTLTLKVCGIITALCQNCLQPMSLTLDRVSRVTIFYNEEQLDTALFNDESSDVEDGVMSEEEFDVLNFLEDEVIMLLPYALKHEECVGISYEDKADSPFDVLKNII
jgi:uncharacterized protein